MKLTFLTIALFSILAILPVSVFAQVSNDLDGDGIPNSEDVCPNDKGTKANKGCPEKTAKPTPTPNPNTQHTANKCVSGDCVNGRGKMLYANGNIYEGDFVNGKREGLGTSTFTNRATYTGQYSKGLFHGKGKYNYPDGGVYEGNWVDGRIEGQGIYTAKDGGYYSGEWKNNKSNGYGKNYNKSTNITLEGTWKDGVFIDSPANIPNINDSEENRVNGLKEYYKRAFQKLGNSVVKEGTAVNTTTRYNQLTVEATLEAGFVYHFIGICPEKILVSGDGDEYEEYFASGSLAKSSVPQKYGLTSYFFTAAYLGKNSSGAFTFKPTRQKVYWILFRSKRNSTKSDDEISKATSELVNDEDLKRIQDIERKERINSAVAGLTPEQRRKAVERLTKMNADEKKVNEASNALIPVWKRKMELNQSFSKLYDKLQSDSKNRLTYAVQMKKDAEEIVRICEEFLSKYGNELGKTDLPSLNAKVDVINQQIREMRTDIVANKKNIERLEKIIKANSQP